MVQPVKPIQLTTYVNQWLVQPGNARCTRTFFWTAALVALLSGQVWLPGWLMRPAADVAVGSFGSAHTAIIGGRPALPRQFPWRVYLEMRYSNRFSVCAGTIIHEKWILTAAHCLYDKPMEIYVRAGTLDRRSGLELSVRRYHYHGGYGGSVGSPHDIALIKLQHDVMLTDEIDTINLPPANAAIPNRLLASGWGKTEALKVSNILLTYEARVDRGCVIARENQFCTDAAERSVCQGDSGSGMDAFLPGHGWVAFGVVSWGHAECKSSQMPNVHTVVTAYLDWISETIARDGRQYGEQ